MILLSVENLNVTIGAGSAAISLVRDVSFAIAPGEVLGLVGESGSGKSMTSLAVMGLLPVPGPAIASGSVRLGGVDVTELAPWQRVADNRPSMAMIFQEPMTSLNPVRRIGDQIVEAVLVRENLGTKVARERARELLELVRIPDAALQLSAFPHQLSGGMRQRVMIAIALASRPAVLIADEPTTALDVTVQAQILGLLRELCEKLHMAMLFISHDMGVMAMLADRVSVMYGGSIVETARVADLFAAPAHPYSRALMDCRPKPGQQGARLMSVPGQAPRAGTIRVGCAFAPRCTFRQPICESESVPSFQPAPGRAVLCRFPIVTGEVA